MNKTKHLFLKLLILLTFGVGWSGSAWAERIEPNIVSAITPANENVSTTWCYIHFVNSSGGYVYCQANGNALAFSGSKRNNNDNLWALIGTKSNFVLRNRNGLYAKWDGGKYLGTVNENEATPCTYTPNTNGGNTTYWNLHRLDASNTTNWNPQSGQIKEWGGDADGGSRMEFVAVTEQEIWDLSYTGPKWYTMKPNNGGYISSDYATAEGRMHVASSNAKPTNYAGIWRFMDVSGVDGQNLINAKYYATRVLSVVGTEGTAVAKMDLASSVRSGSRYKFEIASNGFVKVQGEDLYLGNNSMQLCVRTTTGDGSLNLNLTRVPNLGNAVTIKCIDSNENEITDATIAYSCKREDISSKTVILKHNDVYDFKDVPYMEYIFSDSPTCEIISTSYDEIHATLTFVVRKVESAEWTFNITEGYTVNYNGFLDINNGEKVVLPVNINRMFFSVNGTEDKFVWGPIIDDRYKTITYEVRDLASGTDLPTGWYQLQIADAEVAALSEQIIPKAGNINTKANTLYLAPALYTQTNGIFKVTGVPQYAGEASTFVYVNNNGSGSYSLTSSVTGQDITGPFTYSNGVLTKSGGWSYETSAQPLEGPFLLTSGSSDPSFKVSAADLSGYDIYKVSIKEGDAVASDVRLDISNHNILGSKVVGNGGYLFMQKNSIEPVLSQVSVISGNVSVTDVTTVETDGVKTIIFHVATKHTMWKAVIKGDAAADADRIIYGGNNYQNDASMPLLEGYEPTALDFKTNVTDRFVWGPIIDRAAKTVTFEIRNVVNELTPEKWYQIQFREKEVQYFDGSFQGTKKNIVDVVNEAVTTPVRYKGPYIYAVNPPGTGFPLELTGVMPDGNDASTYIYVAARSGNNVTIQNQNGIYVQNHGGGSSSSSVSAPLVFNNETNAFTWNHNTIPWSKTDTAPYITIGNTGSAQNGNIEMFFHPVDVKAYKITGTGGYKVEYNGSAKVIGSKMVADGYFLFLESDQSIEGEGSTIDASKFALKGTSETITSISAATTGGYTTLTFTITAPSYSNTIIHRQHDVYDRIEAVSDDLLPKGSHIKRGEGMMAHPMAAGFTSDNTANDRLIQNTSVFHVTQYTKPGTSTECVLPYTKGKGTGNHVKQYQRWYDYKTERPLATGIQTLSSNFYQFANGYCNYNSSGTRLGDAIGSTSITLLSGSTELYVGVDASEYSDLRFSNGNLIEPSLNMRVIYHIISAHEMAKELTTSGDKWWEAKEYFVPNIKRGSDTYKNNADLIPLDMPFSNYWIYKTTGNTTDANLMPIVAENGNYNTLRSNLEIVVEGSAKDYLEVGVLDGNPGNIGGAPYINSNHFLYYKVKGSGVTRTIPAGSQAVIKVYAKDGSNSSSPKYQLFKFTLNFQAASEPLAITSVVGNPASTRSVDYFIQNGFKESASLTFQKKDVSFTRIDGHRNDGNEGITYAFPIDFSRTSYGYSPNNTFGNYRITTKGYGIQYRPVSLYERNIKNRANTSMQSADDYFFYIDAAESPGQVASITLDGTLCPGSRLYCYGWVGSTNYYNGDGNPYAASVLLQVVGHRSNGTEEVVASYLPGTLTDVSYDDEGDEMHSLSYGAFPSQQQAGWMDLNATQVGVWNNVGFSFVVKDVSFDSYDLRIINNCFSTQGGDYVLDDFRVFMSPPKGNVDFTTPLCSDKVRHAKVHTDFDMLLNASGVNETAEDAKLNVSYCFLDAEVFDNYTNGSLTIKNIFEIDETGNHNLKHEYAANADAMNLINAAFGRALVGTRTLASATNENGGFHTFNVNLNYNSIPEYAYIDSKNEVVYREEGSDGIRRIVFKEDVVRGEMAQIEYDGYKHYPHMRPSTTYYLVFTPNSVGENNISNHTVATLVFKMHESCSFLGKFTTKDPLHVILDNADIESDLPIRAVCHGEKTAFSFDIPALKVDKPIVDEAYCVSEESLSGKIVPESQGLNHYKYEASFKNNDISGVIKNLPYDWWMGGLKFDNETTYRGTIEDYHAAKHPTIKYDHNTADPSHTHTHAADYKKHQEPVDISLAMQDFRFFYPDFKEGDDWGTLQVHDYDNDSGYSLLQSEINAIRDLVGKGIIILHRNTYDMPLTYEEAEELQAKELSDMMEKEMNDQILELALMLNTDPAIAALLPLKALESTVLDKLSLDGKKRLTFEEFGSFTRDQLVDIAGHLQTQKSKLTELTSEQINAMPEGDLRRVVESALRELPDDEMLGFAKDYFPNIGHEKRAYLVVRALNILSRETVAALSPEDQQNSVATRQALRNQMISIFREQKVEVLRKMWSDTSAKLTEEERAALLEDKDPATMNADDLAVLIEDALAKLTDNVINDLQGDRYVHFTLVPIMPSQDNFVDQPYIFCPEPRGVKLRITSHEPEMLDGFADMTYPEDMKNVPVRVGLPQIRETKASTSKVLRIPVRGLKKAAKDGEKAVKLAEHTGYETYLFLTETDDPQYQQSAAAGMAAAKNTDGIYDLMVGKVQTMKAVYPTTAKPNPDNYLEVYFENDMQFREGYTYRVGVNFMEMKEVEEGGVKVDKPTISCYGTMLFDMKIVPEYQKWTAAVSNTDWTNDRNWARADRDELNASNAASDGIKPLDAYITNEANQTANSFVPMYFTNVLIDNDASAPVLYIEKETEESDAYTPASRSGKTFLKGLHSTATPNIIYDMEVAPADGKGTWPENEGNYECTLFGTYIANGITFKPGAQMGNTHYLIYNKAWVEYSLDAERWYTIGSPLKNSFAGDWYSPTAGGKQLTPHFYDINYNPALNDRFRPAYYQRSWDREGNNTVYTKTGGSYDSYIKADWSYVYNDAAVSYTNGGFSVKAELGYMTDGVRTDAAKPEDNKVLVRLPKADETYTYYAVDGSTGQAQAAQIGDRTQSYRLHSDELKNGESFTLSVANKTADNNFLLLSNPFMAAMDMEKFFDANTDLEAKYWIVSGDKQVVSLKTAAEGWITTEGVGGKYVAPLQGFFVKKKDNAEKQNEVTATYTAAMQTVVTASPTDNNPGVSLQSRGQIAPQSDIIRLIAERNGSSSEAVIMLSEGANDGYLAGEDCQTFIDGNLYDKATVYTSAGSMAQTINVRKTLNMVPLGIISSDDSEAVLRFDLSGSTMAEGSVMLYDSKTDEYIEVSDGTEVIMSGNNSGRYFITTSDLTSITDIDADNVIRHGVWSVNGRYIGDTIEGLAPGLYIVDGVKMNIR